MSNPLISIVIPTYNYGHFVTAAIDSALTQTFTDHEVIVVDDGSQDGTRERLRPYMDRIRYIYQENRGLSAARNAGIQAARGEWIALLDSDDIWHPRKLELQAEFVHAQPSMGLIATAYVEGCEGQWPPIELHSWLESRVISYAELLIRARFGPSGVLIRRSCLEEIGLFDISLRSAEDRDMWIRIARRYQVILLTQPLWWYRKHGMSMSKSCVRMETNELAVLRKAFAYRCPGDHTLALRMKAYSFACYSSSIRYAHAGDQSRALARMVRSFLLWPLPYQLSEVRNTFLSRPKKLISIIVDGIRSKFR